MYLKHIEWMAAWKVVLRFSWRNIERVKNSLVVQPFMLLRWGILLSRKCIKRSPCMLIIWETFNTKLFYRRKWENILCQFVLNVFHCLPNLLYPPISNRANACLTSYCFLPWSVYNWISSGKWIPLSTLWRIWHCQNNWFAWYPDKLRMKRRDHRWYHCRDSLMRQLIWLLLNLSKTIWGSTRTKGYWPK